MADLDWCAEAEALENEPQSLPEKVKELQITKSEPKSEVVEGDKTITQAESSYLTKVLRTRLLNTSSAVEVQRADPNSPLYSVKSFEELRL